MLKYLRMFKQRIICRMTEHDNYTYSKKEIRRYRICNKCGKILEEDKNYLPYPPNHETILERLREYVEMHKGEFKKRRELEEELNELKKKMGWEEKIKQIKNEK